MSSALGDVFGNSLQLELIIQQAASSRDLG
jgi:hypothetical protein